MDDTFHHRWLIIGDSANRYTKPYDVIPLREAPDYTETALKELASGFTCRYANKLRNGNINLVIDSGNNSRITVKKIAETNTKAIYNCGENMLMMHHGEWALYDSNTIQKIAEGPWGNNETSFFCFDSGFYIFDEVLLHFSPLGKLLGEVFITSGSDLKHHEIALIGDYTISAGYLKASSFPDGLPGRVQPSGQLESFKLADFETPDEPDEILEPAHTNMLAFVEEDPLIPVYLDDMLVQPINNKIALLSFNLEILKVLEGEFYPISVSANENSILYMTAFVENKIEMVAFDTKGNIIFKVDIPGQLGKCKSPPLISTDGNIYWVGEKGVIVFNQSGDNLWSKYLNTQPEQEIFPLLYNNFLTLGYGSSFMVLDNNGEILAVTEFEDEIINTPLISNGKGRYFIGTETGLLEIEFHQE